MDRCGMKKFREARGVRSFLIAPATFVLAAMVAGGAVVVGGATFAKADNPASEKSCTYYPIGVSAEAFTSRKLPGQFQYPRFSPSGNWFVANSRYGADMGGSKVLLMSLQTGKSFQASVPDQPYDIKFSPDESTMVEVYNGGKILVADLRTGKIELQDFPAAVKGPSGGSAYVSGNAKYVKFTKSVEESGKWNRVATILRDLHTGKEQKLSSDLDWGIEGKGDYFPAQELNKLAVYSTKTGKIEELDFEGIRAVSQCDEKNNVQVLVEKNGGTEVFELNLDTREKKLLYKVPATFNLVYLPEGQRKIIAQDWLSKDSSDPRRRTTIVSDGKPIPIKDTNPLYTQGFSPSGNTAFLMGPPATVLAKSLKDGSEKTIPVTHAPFDLIPYDDTSAFAVDNGGVQLFDFKEGRKVTVFSTGGFSHIRGTFENGHPVFSWVDWQGDTLYSFKPEMICVEDRIKVAMDARDCPDCGAGAQSGGAMSVGASTFESLSSSALCSTTFLPEAWDRITPYPAPSSLSREQAKKYLLRFQKPGGFEPKKHLEILTAILKSGLVSAEPGLVAAAMQGVLHASIFSIMTSFQSIRS